MFVLKSNSIPIDLKPKENSESFKICKKHYNNVISQSKKRDISEVPDMKTSSPFKLRNEKVFNPQYKYSIINNQLLLDLLKKAHFKCDECSENMEFNNFQDLPAGGIIGYKFICPKCNNDFSFFNSNKLSDLSWELNRDLGASWTCLGLENSDFAKFFEEMDLGVMSVRTLQNHQDVLYTIIDELAETKMKEVINTVNKRGAAELQTDVQWSRPQKKGSRAFSATATAIDDFSEKVCAFVCVNNKDIISNNEYIQEDPNGNPIKCLEKFSIINLLNVLMMVFTNIAIITSDQCGSLKKWVEEILLEKFPNLLVCFDLWHFLQPLGTTWNKFIEKKNYGFR